MIRRTLRLGRWKIDFFFAPDGYGDEEILTRLYDIDAPISVLQDANRVMKKSLPNCGFTYANGDLRRAVVVVGPTTSGAEFQNTFVHEAHHLAVAIARELGIDLKGEGPAYLAGDSALALADVLCELGCKHCHCR